MHKTFFNKINKFLDFSNFFAFQLAKPRKFEKYKDQMIKPRSSFCDHTDRFQRILHCKSGEPDGTSLPSIDAEAESAEDGLVNSSPPAQPLALLPEMSLPCDIAACPMEEILPISPA